MRRGWICMEGYHCACAEQQGGRLETEGLTGRLEAILPGAEAGRAHWGFQESSLVTDDCSAGLADAF
jgi:hypothetical protein